MKLFLHILLITLVSLSFTHADEAKVNVLDGELKESLNNELEEGRYELVMFWATYCGTCKSDFKKLGKFIKKNPDIPLTLVGIVVDGIEEEQHARSLVDKHDLNYSHLLTDYNTANKFYLSLAESEIMGTPSYLLYDKENKMIGFNPSAIDVEALEMFFDE